MISACLRIAVCVLFALATLLPRAADAVDPYEINVILPLTGTYAFVGKGSQAGLAGVEASERDRRRERPADQVRGHRRCVEPAEQRPDRNALMTKGVPVILRFLGASCGAIFRW